MKKSKEKEIKESKGERFLRVPLKSWLCVLEVKTSYIALGSPWGNGYNEIFSGKLRDELLRCESFYSMKEVEILIENRCRHYKDIRPHNAFGHLSPAAALDHPICPKASSG